MKNSKSEFQTLLNTHSTYAYKSLSVPAVYVSSILDALLSNSWTELLFLVTIQLVRFAQVKNSMDNLRLNNEYIPYLSYTVEERGYIIPIVLWY